MEPIFSQSSDQLLEKAERCRRLAQDTHDAHIASQLRVMAGEYAQRAKAKDAGRSF